MLCVKLLAHLVGIRLRLRSLRSLPPPCRLFDVKGGPVAGDLGACNCLARGADVQGESESRPCPNPASSGVGGTNDTACVRCVHAVFRAKSGKIFTGARFVPWSICFAVGSSPRVPARVDTASPLASGAHIFGHRTPCLFGASRAAAPRERATAVGLGKTRHDTTRHDNYGRPAVQSPCASSLSFSFSRSALACIPISSGFASFRRIRRGRAFCSARKPDFRFRIDARSY